MKLNSFHWIAITTILLLTTVIFVMMNLSFGLVFYTIIGGQVLLIYTVYKVLTDTYKTDKTFDDFYEDRPDLGNRQ